MAGNNEIMSHFFDQNEYEKVRSEAEKLGLSERQAEIESQSIDLKLLALKEKIETRTEANFIDRFNAYKTAVLEAEALEKAGSVAAQAQAAVEDAATEAVESATGAATQAVQDSLFGKIGAIKDSVIAKIAATFGIGATGVSFLSENINPVSWLKSGFEGDGFLGWIGGFLGYKKSEEPKPDIETKGVPEEGEEEKTETPVDNTENRAALVEGDETIDTKDSSYFHGTKLIVGLTAHSQAPVNEDSNSTYAGLQDMSYIQVRALSSDTIPSGFYANQDDSSDNKDMYKHIVDTLGSDESKDLLDISLQTKFLKRIIKPRGKWNTALIPHFGNTPRDAKATLTKLIDGDIVWDNLSFKQVSILYFHSLSTLKVPAINGMKELGGDMQKLLIGEDSELQKSINDLQTSIPPSLLLGFGTLETSIMTKQSLTLTDSQKSDIFAKIPETKIPESKEVFDDIMQFQATVLSEDFINNPKLGLNTEQKELYRNHISLGHILTMYSLMGGIPDLNTIPTLSLPPFIYLIGKILERGNSSNSYTAKLYLGNYTKNVLFGEQDGLSEDEYKIMEIYGGKAIDIIFLSHVRSLQGALGLSESATGLSTGELALGIGGAGLLSRFIGNKTLKSGIEKGKFSLFGAALKKIGNIGIVAGIALGGTHWYTKFSTGGAQKNIQASIESGNIENVVTELKKHRDAIKTIDINGVEAKVYAYPGDTPLYIINGKVYGIKAGELNSVEIVSEEWNDLSVDSLKRIGDKLLDWVLPKTAVTEGVDYSIQQHDGENVSFGNGEKSPSMSFKEIFEKISNASEEIIGEDSARALFSGEREIPFKLGSEGEKGFVISKVPGDENKILFAAEIGTVDEVFGEKTS